MSFKFDSMMIILNKIDRGEKVTIGSLKKDLEVSERTAHRYLETLQLSGYPLYYDRPRERYLFSEGYTLKQPGLDSEEFLAMALAKKMIRKLGPEFEAGLTLIEKKLTGRGAEAVPRILVSEGEAPPRAAYLEPLNRAALHFQRVEFFYEARSSRVRTRRRVEPDYLFYQEGLWYLRGYCCLREEFRTFALDRMEALQVLEEYFVPRQRSGDEELAASFGSFLDGEPEEVTLAFDPEIRPYIQRRRWHSSQEEEELADGRLMIRFRVKGLEGIGRWIYRWLPQVEVLAPPSLREKIQEDLRKGLRKYGAGERNEDKGTRNEDKG
jgi:predicted DNA-binding transcriptional regulator YafY